MDDTGTLVAKLALRSKLITEAQYETVSQAYVKSGGRKPYGAILLESGILNGGAFTRLLQEHQQRIIKLVEDIFSRRILEKGYATEDAIRDSHATLEDIRLHGFDFDMLELLVKRNAISQAQASELRQYLRAKILICPLCLRTEPRNGHEPASACPECHEEFAPGASDRLMSKFVSVAAMFPGQAPAPASGPPSSIMTGGADVPPQLGAYRIGREVGRGGMAVVYDAEDLRTGDRVALKVLKPGSALDKSNLSRFYSEIESLQKLDHPHVVRVLGVGEAAGHHFYAMQFIDGRGLDRMVNECKQDLRRTVAWVRDIARALHSAHDRGIVHRDVKPGNILVDREGKAYLTDFGLALRDRAVRVTLSGTTLGTPNFMSPEQARGERHRLDRRTDVYSLGATLYNLCTGRVPYWENTPELVIQKILNEDPKPSSSLNPSIDRPLQTIIHKAMDKEPGNRYESAAEMAEDLQRWLAGEPIHAAPSTRRVRLRKWWVTHRRTIVIAVGSAAAASALAGLLYIRQLSVTESMASDLSRAMEEAQRYRQNRKPPIERYEEDRDSRLRRARGRVADESANYDRQLYDAVQDARKLNQKEGKTGEAAAAREHLATVEELKQFGGALYETGEFEMKRGEFAVGLVFLKKAEQVYQGLADYPKKVDRKTMSLLNANQHFKDNTNVAQHLAILDGWIAKCEAYEVWMRWLADKNGAAALVSMDDIVRRHSGPVDALVRRGLLHVRVGRPEQAAADFNAVLIKEPKHFDARLGLAELRLKQGNPEEAAVELSKLPESRRRNGPEVALLEGLRLRMSNDLKSAMEVLEFKQEPSALPDLPAAYAVCLQALGRNEEAARLAIKADEQLRDLEDRIHTDYERLTGRPDLAYEIWSTIAKANHKLKRFTDAKAAAKRALAVRPNDPDMVDVLKGIIR